jgi:hypothetical protein
VLKLDEPFYPVKRGMRAKIVLLVQHMRRPKSKVMRCQDI